MTRGGLTVAQFTALAAAVSIGGGVRIGARGRSAIRANVAARLIELGLLETKPGLVAERLAELGLPPRPGLGLLCCVTAEGRAVVEGARRGRGGQGGRPRARRGSAAGAG
jgi:hypothetical protein